MSDWVNTSDCKGRYFWDIQICLMIFFFALLSKCRLTHPPVPHICVSELGQRWFRQWLVACSAPSHYLDQCWVIVNCILRNKPQWNQNTKLFIHKMHLKISSAKWQPFCLGLNVLNLLLRVETNQRQTDSHHHWLRQCLGTEQTTGLHLSHW